MKRVQVRKQVTRVIAVVALVLMVGGFIVPVARAGDPYTDNYIQYMIDQWVDICRQNGGTPDVYNIFGNNGSYNAATVNCFGQTGSWGKTWACSVDHTGTWLCSHGFPQPPQSPSDTAADQPGTIEGAHDEGPTPVDIEQAEGRPSVPTRPENTPTPAPEEREGR